jgi:hypothetical protein
METPPLDFALRNAVSLKQLQTISRSFLPSPSVDNLNQVRPVGIHRPKELFRKVVDSQPKLPNFSKPPLLKASGLTRSQVEQRALQEMLEEQKLNSSEKNYFADKIRRKIKEFKAKAATQSKLVEVRLNRRGVFSKEVNQERSATMMSGIMRKMLTKSLPGYISQVKEEIKGLRNGRSLYEMTAVDQADKAELQAQQRRELLDSLKKAVTNQVKEHVHKGAEAKLTGSSVQGKLAKIITEKLPQRRVKPL